MRDAGTPADATPPDGVEPIHDVVVLGSPGETSTAAAVAHLLMDGGRAPGFRLSAAPLSVEGTHRPAGESAGPWVFDGATYRETEPGRSPRAVAVLAAPAPSDRAWLERLIADLSEDSLVVAWAGDSEVRALLRVARCRPVFVALSSDEVGEALPTWMAAPIASRGGAQPFELFIGGAAAGTVLSRLYGRHNVRYAAAALALTAEMTGAPLTKLISSLARFDGIRGHQELVGIGDGVFVFDEVARDPAAVAESLDAVRARVGQGEVFALISSGGGVEPELERALLGADRWLRIQPSAPVGPAELAPVRPHDAVLCLSASDPGLPDRVLATLAGRSCARARETEG